MEFLHTNLMNIQVNKRESVFENLHLVEQVDELALHKLINSDLLKGVCNKFNNKYYENEKEQLQNYRKLIKNGFTHVIYNKIGFGRCSAVNGLSYLGLRKTIRHTLSSKHMTDLDIENCHPVLMVQMLDKYGFNCPNLKNYINNRSDYLEIVKTTWQVDKYVPSSDVRDCCKNLFLMLMYGGLLSTWLDTWKLPPINTIPEQILNFINEVSEIIDLFYNLNPEVKTQVESKQKKSNIRGAVCSIVMQEIECIVLEVIYLYLTRRFKTNVISLCADGLMIDKKLYNSRLLQELEIEVLIKTGFVIKMTQKSLDNGYTHEQLDEHIINDVPYIPNKDFKHVEEIVNRLNILYDDFKLTKYFDDSMTINKYSHNLIKLNCSKNKCSLCKVKHVKNATCSLKINGKNDFVFNCHKCSKVFKKSNKGKLLLREIRMENIDQNIQEFFNLNDCGIDNVIHEDSLFIGCDEDNEIVMKREYNNKYLILSAHMGKGKTTFIKTMLQLREAKRILFVSQRKTFTNFICDEFKELRVTNYLDIKDKNYDVDRICIQVESLHKITNVKYDVVIIDEVETVLNQFSSGTMTHTRECWAVFKQSVTQSSWCLLADAFILNRTLDFVRAVKTENEKITLLVNEKAYLNGRKCIQVSQDMFNENLINHLNEDKRIVVISGSRTDMLDLVREVKIKCPDKNVKAYDRDSDKSELKHVNESWNTCDLVAYTPVIQTGISYMNTPFDLCYANLKSSNLSRDAMQMLMRCRVLRDNTVYFSISKRQIYNTSNINMFETFEFFEKDRHEKTLMLIDDLKKNATLNKELISMLEISLKTTDKTLLKVMWHNLREHMLSQCHYNSMCLYLLRKQGYDVVMLNEDDHNKDKVSEVIKFEYEDEYNSITDIDYDDIEKLKYSEMGKEERLRVDKFYFEKLTVEELPTNVKSKLFFEYYQVSHKKNYLSNVKYEKSDLTSEEIMLKDFEKNNKLVTKMKMINKKLEVIREFNKMLGLLNSCQDGYVIDKKNITGPVLKYIKENEEFITRLYNSKVKMTGSKTSDNFNSLKLVQKVYKDWSGLTLKKHNADAKGNAENYITSCFNIYDCIKAFPRTEAQDFIALMMDD